LSQYTCRYCRQSQESASTCTLCGAPIDIRSRVTDSGWMEQPMISDMTRLSCGQTRVQILGTVVPAAEFSLAPDDAVYFVPPALRWVEAITQLVPLPADRDDQRLTDLPAVMLEGRGPGHIGVAANHAGELIAVPLRSGHPIRVQHGRFLCATGLARHRWRSTAVHYRRFKHGEAEPEYPMGKYCLQFALRPAQSHQETGLVLLHASGNSFIRDLGADETILVQPNSLLYWDDELDISLHLEYPKFTGVRNKHDPSSYRNIWLRLRGPGRVAVQSAYEPTENAGIPDHFSFASTKRW
jgi:biogenesis AIM24-like protein